MFNIDTFCGLALMAFNVWSWLLACWGSSSIEFLQDLWDSDEEISRKQTMEFGKNPTMFTDNIFEIFGTHKMMRVLSPSLRSVPFTGIEWAFLMQDLGFN